jgi:RNA polymerase sigma-70 factor (ECF subfamily)
MRRAALFRGHVQCVEEKLNTLLMNLRDPAQFRDAYRRLAPVALVSANQVLRDNAAAEDVVQEVFMQLWLKPDAFDPERGGLSRYVSMLARSRALDRWRTRAARDRTTLQARIQARALQEPTESAAEPVIRRDRAQALVRALAELPRDQRDALMLAYARGLSSSEIARECGIPLGTAKSRLRLGLSKARATLEAAA